jgi:hypothetical protein
MGTQQYGTRGDDGIPSIKSNEKHNETNEVYQRRNETKEREAFDWMLETTKPSAMRRGGQQADAQPGPAPRRSTSSPSPAPVKSDADADTGACRPLVTTASADLHYIKSQKKIGSKIQKEMKPRNCKALYLRTRKAEESDVMRNTQIREKRGGKRKK